ncbi:MAG: hypothetical protein PHH88_01330 [Candidatus Pacebacteria bacterium]|nr:hypothetical protein [Candidatus Paceibacterota bacterium]MDD4333763.1 hypothetical protein [Candidatus Paceibacterota bacterium]
MLLTQISTKEMISFIQKIIEKEGIVIVSKKGVFFGKCEIAIMSDSDILWLFKTLNEKQLPKKIIL